jgi:hypothetical protein
MLKIQSWQSMNGPTYVVVEHHCILSFHKTREEAEAAMAQIERARTERAIALAGRRDEAQLQQPAPPPRPEPSRPFKKP